MSVKKNFWLKLKNDFFDRDEIKIIENNKNGKDYIIFYMKLLLKSIESDGKLFFRQTIPYSPSMLSTITNTSEDTVKVAVDLFIGLGLMEKWDDGTLFMLETQNMVGAESKWANYKRVERENKKHIGHCPKESKKSQIDIEIELEKEKLEKLNQMLLIKQINKDKRADRLTELEEQKKEI
ncbi:MAG: phage replisome organizer N-terminal domain-containing protein [Arcobacteraceae bacterium]